MLNRDSLPIVLAVGSAGSGKSCLCASVAAQKLFDGDVSKIVVTRPAVPVEEEHGFLPGTLDEKMAPWIQPIVDTLRMYFSSSQIKEMIEDKVIELAPIAFCRGRTFNDAIIILDEAQSCTANQMLMMTTRIGHNSKLVVTGDLAQSDIKGTNGLQDLIERIGEGVPGEIEIVRFDDRDVVRNPVIKTILRLYKD